MGLLCRDVHGSLLAQSLTPEEHRFVTSHEDVFRYSPRDGPVQVDQHGVFDCKKDIYNAVDIVKKLLSVAAGRPGHVD